MTTVVCYANHRRHAVERYDRDSNLNGAFLCQGRSKKRAARGYNLYEALRRQCNNWSNLVLVNLGFRTWKTLRKLSAIWARSQKILPLCPRPERISFCKGACLGRLHVSGRPYRGWYWPVYVSGHARADPPAKESCEIQWNLLEQTAASGCESFPTF